MKREVTSGRRGSQTLYFPFPFILITLCRRRFVLRTFPGARWSTTGKNQFCISGWWGRPKSYFNH